MWMSYPSVQSPCVQGHTRSWARSHRPRRRAAAGCGAGRGALRLPQRRACCGASGATCAASNHRQTRRRLLAEAGAQTAEAAAAPRQLRGILPRAPLGWSYILSGAITELTCNAWSKSEADGRFYTRSLADSTFAPFSTETGVQNLNLQDRPRDAALQLGGQRRRARPGRW